MLRLTDLAHLIILVRTKVNQFFSILKGKTVVITGATSGIGLQTAILVAKHGAKVIIGCINLENGNKKQSGRNFICNETNKLFLSLENKTLMSCLNLKLNLRQSQPKACRIVSSKFKGLLKNCCIFRPANACNGWLSGAEPGVPKFLLSI